MKTLIADDEPHLAEDLRRRLIRVCPEAEVVALVHDGVAAADALIRLRPDVAFLDIRMPGISGLEAALAATQNCRIVFVTAYDTYAVQAFELDAADYLLKPLSDERLENCVQRLRRKNGSDSEALLARLSELLPKTDNHKQPLRWLRAQAGQTIRLIAVDEISYLQSADKYTLLYTRDAELVLRTPLRQLIRQLDPTIFWQVHRSTVVNAHQIVAAHHEFLGKLSLSLRDRPERITVSRSYAHLFRQM